MYSSPTYKINKYTYSLLTFQVNTKNTTMPQATLSAPTQDRSHFPLIVDTGITRVLTKEGIIFECVSVCGGISTFGILEVMSSTILFGNSVYRLGPTNLG